MFSAIKIFTLLFPILPTYFTIAGFGVYRMLAITLLVVYFLCNKNKYKIKVSKFDICFYIWMLAQLLISLINGDVKNAILIFIMTIFPKIIFDKYVNCSERFYVLIDILVYGGLFVTIFGAISVITSFDIFKLLNTANIELIDQYRLGITRVKGFTYQTITYGNYLIMISALCFYRLSMLSTSKKKYIFFLTYALIAVNVICTASRSTILLYLVCQILLYYKCGSTKFIKYMFSIFITAVCFVVIITLFGMESNLFTNAVYLILAMFSTNYQSRLTTGLYDSTSFTGVGDRILLYKWVADSMNENWLIGHGPNSIFRYQLTGIVNGYVWSNYKTSIEVEYLRTLFHYGLIGMFSEIIFLGSTIYLTLKKRYVKLKEETNVSFNVVCRIMFIVYYLSFFAVMQDTESRMFYIIFYLLICYNMIADKDVA